MPASATANRPEEVAERLAAFAAAAVVADTSACGEALLVTLREVKNQIIGNKTKKLAYLHLGAVPHIVSILAYASLDPSANAAQLLIQSAVALGSFSCGLDAGVRAVLDAGAAPHLTRILSHADEKVVDAGARSLRMIFQSKLAPKYDILQEKHMNFLLLLLNSDNENLTELAATIIAHSCEGRAEQKALSDSGVLQRLVTLIGVSLNQTDSSLECISAIVKNNSEVAANFVGIGDGKALEAVVELMKDKYPRTRLLACMCLIVIDQASPCHVQLLEIKSKLIPILVDLIEEPGEPGYEAPFALANLIQGKEQLHKQVISVNAVEKLCNLLCKGKIEEKRLQGILLALAELCSQLEKCRCQLMSPQRADDIQPKIITGTKQWKSMAALLDSSLQVFCLVVDALKHDSAEVQISACACLKSISRSVKNISAGRFCNETVLSPLVQLLRDTSHCVQVAALGAICNIVVYFSRRNPIFVECGINKELIQLSKSMDSVVRLNAVCALRNLMFHADRVQKEILLLELTESTLVSLICDAESCIQEQALALVCNLLDGCADSIERIFAEGCIIIDAIARQMHHNSTLEMHIQGMFVFSNIATGSELHKDAVINYLLSPQRNERPLFVIQFLQSPNSFLRTAAMWCMVNLTFPGSQSTFARVSRLCEAGVIPQIKSMVDDPCIDVKYRVRTVLQQIGLVNSPS